ncbi:MAG: signal peptidase II [Campylobacterota bacterium]|nr:signal peptidase II [Campylobacterota bacterium]
MLKKYLIFTISIVTLFIIDQYIKSLFVNGFEARGECISLVLAYNYGVAFSMFSFLEGNLKYIQIAIMFAGLVYLIKNKDVFSRYYFAAALVVAGGVSNIYDRFIHGGVVDYVYWHCMFDFAIFNLADVLIDIGVVLLLYINYKEYKEEEKQKKEVSSQDK